MKNRKHSNKAIKTLNDSKLLATLGTEMQGKKAQSREFTITGYRLVGYIAHSVTSFGSFRRKMQMKTSQLTPVAWRGREGVAVSAAAEQMKVPPEQPHPGESSRRWQLND